MRQKQKIEMQISDSIESHSALGHYAEPSEAKNALAIDHFVFPVRSLETIKTHMERLGFTLAPQAQHPFGTTNICLFLKGDVYIEFLAVHDACIYQRAKEDGLPFIRDIDRWRQSKGDEGFAGLAFASNDAAADQSRFEAMGISAGKIGEFSRDFSLPDGTTDTASFRTAHTSLPAMAEIICFTCQRVKVPVVDRSLLESHENTVQGVKKIIIAAPQPLDLRNCLTKLFDCPPTLAIPDALGFTLPNVELLALSPPALLSAYGVDSKTSTPQLAGLILTLPSLSLMEEYFAQNQLTCYKHNITLEHLPKSGDRFLDKKCDKNNKLELSVEQSETKITLVHHLFNHSQVFLGFEQS